VYAHWPSEAFEISGELASYDGRGFCPRCGSRILDESNADDGVVELRLGSLDEAPFGLVPHDETWVKRRERWIPPVEGAVQHDARILHASGMTKSDSPAELIDRKIAELDDWRGETLARMRRLIHEADADVVEEWKWVSATKPGTPVWSRDGIICTGESYKSIVKLTFAKGASLKDPARLFNSSLEGNTRRAIDIHEGEELDESAFKALIRQAVALNSSGKSSSKKAKR
jgi:hypothetical protein